MLSDSSQLLEEMKQEISLCIQLVPFDPDTLFFEQLDLDSYLANSQNFEKFDYIEYNCGVSIDPNYSNHLRKFRVLLSDDGVMGILSYRLNTFFLTLRFRDFILCKKYPRHEFETADWFVKLLADGSF